MTKATITKEEARQTINHKRMFRLALENYGEVAAIEMLAGRLDQQGHEKAAFRLRQAVEVLGRPELAVELLKD